MGRHGRKGGNGRNDAHQQIRRLRGFCDKLVDRHSVAVVKLRIVEINIVRPEDLLVYASVDKNLKPLLPFVSVTDMIARLQQYAGRYYQFVDDYGLKDFKKRGTAASSFIAVWVNMTVAHAVRGLIIRAIATSARTMSFPYFQ
jgi:hypothetical protein